MVRPLSRLHFLQSMYLDAAETIRCAVSILLRRWTFRRIVALFRVSLDTELEHPTHMQHVRWEGSPKTRPNKY
jgi:hypothetical protein